MDEVTPPSSLKNPAIARPPVETLSLKSEPVSQYAAVISEIRTTFRGLKSPLLRNRILLIAVVLLVVLLVNIVWQIYLNQWQGDFFRAIERKDLNQVGLELLVFLKLILVLLTVVVSQTWLHERLKINLREWFTKGLLNQWLEPNRAYRLAISSDEAVNPDQRIQEDVRNYSEMTADLSVGLTQATLLLFSFIGVLWAMSQNVQFHIGDKVFSIPGYMVWAALIYALLGSLVTAWVGRPLITLYETRYQQEANFRFSIVRVNESAESVAFYRGESDERISIDSNLNNVLRVMRTMSFAIARLTWITSAYGWLMIVIPVMIALPGFLQGALDLGGLMMVVGAFNQVQNSLRWFVDNFGKIADWRAALHRVAIFKDALMTVDIYENQDEQIQLEDHPEGHLTFEQTKVSLIDGQVVIADATAHVYPGERVLIVGESGSGKSTLFRAIGGLWPWGSGTIRLPPRRDMMFLPQRPYMPLGTLATALSYPRSSGNIDRDLITAAMKRVNLDEFLPQLDHEERWDKLMSLGQQQRLAFARLLIHKPKWVFLDEATSALDDKNQDLVMSLFAEELSGSTMLSIAHRSGLDRYHTRTLQLIDTQAGTILRRRPRPAEKPKFWKRFAQKVAGRALGTVP